MNSSTTFSKRTFKFHLLGHVLFATVIACLVFVPFNGNSSLDVISNVLSSTKINSFLIILFHLTFQVILRNVSGSDLPYRLSFKVFKSLRDGMTQNPAVEWFMMDFEAAAWNAVREVFPHTIKKGCVFHFTQALYRKIQAFGLSMVYIQRDDKYLFLRKVMSLPFLPAEHIRPTFKVLEDQAQESAHEGLISFMMYVRKTWFESSIWHPENWSVFQQTVRTNNDVEGWHHRINGRVGCVGHALYILVPLLLQESRTVEIGIQLVLEQSRTRYQKLTYRKTHARLQKLWDEYEDGVHGMTTSKLLKEVSYLDGIRAIFHCIASILVFHFIAVMFGAAFTENSAETFHLALLLTCTTVIPSFIHIGISSDSWIKVFAQNSPEPGTESMVYYASLFSAIGTWIGALPIPLDWDRPWQIWPVSCVFGALIGHCFGLLLNSVYIFVFYYKTNKFKFT